MTNLYEGLGRIKATIGDVSKVLAPKRDAQGLLPYDDAEWALRVLESMVIEQIATGEECSRGLAGSRT